MAGFRRYMWGRVEGRTKFRLRFQALGNLMNRNPFARVHGARITLRRI